MRARLRGRVEPLQKSSPRCSTPLSLLLRLLPSPLPNWPLSRCAARGQGASNRLPSSRCVELPPQPRASTPQVTFPRRVAAAASPAPIRRRRCLGPPHQGRRVPSRQVHRTAPPSPLSASTPRPLRPSRAVVAQGRRAKSARPCRAIVVAQGLRRYTGLHTRPPAHSLARSCRSPRRNCPVECLALRWLLYIRHCIYCIGEALHHLPLTNAFHYWSQPKHRWWRWRRGTNSMRIGYTDVAHRT
jgi:hypothetical protein